MRTLVYFITYLEGVLHTLDIDPSIFADYITGLLATEGEDDVTTTISQWLCDLTLSTASSGVDHYSIAEDIKQKYDGIGSNEDDDYIIAQDTEVPGNGYSDNYDHIDYNDNNSNYPNVIFYDDLQEQPVLNVNQFQNSSKQVSKEWYPADHISHSTESHISSHNGEEDNHESSTNYGEYDYENQYEGEGNEEDYIEGNLEGYTEGDGEDYTDMVALAIDVEDKLLIQCPNLVFSSEAIYVVLYDCQGDSHLTAVTIENSYNEAAICKPCRHMMTGKCYKHECPFQHDVSYITCKFWLLAQGCSALSVHDGGTCPFQHRAFPPTVEPGGSFTIHNDSNDSETTDLFPALPSKSSTPINIHQENEYADALRRVSKEDNVHSSTFAKSSSSSLSSSSTTDKSWIENLGAISSSNNGNSKKASRMLPGDWVDSGTSVGSVYTALRVEARTFALSRNKLLEQATQQYLGGNKGVAKKLSAEGQRLNVLMKECHTKAAQDLFSHRNTQHSILSMGRLDLHGLHVNEAILCLTDMIPSLRLIGMANIVIVTGTSLLSCVYICVNDWTLIFIDYIHV